MGCSPQADAAAPAEPAQLESWIHRGRPTKGKAEGLRGGRGHQCPAGPWKAVRSIGRRPHQGPRVPTADILEKVNRKRGRLKSRLLQCATMERVQLYTIISR